MEHSDKENPFAFVRQWEKWGGKPAKQMEADGYVLTPCNCGEKPCMGWEWTWVKSCANCKHSHAVTGEVCPFNNSNVTECVPDDLLKWEQK